MRRLMLSFAGIAALAVSSPALSATVIFNLLGNTSLSGTVGNVRTFTVTQGSASVTASISAFAISTTNATGSGGSGGCAIGSTTYNTANCITKSYLGDFGQGLGVTSSGDSSGSNNLHTIDNVDQQDFIIIVFDRKVKLISATFTPFSVDGSTDSDATIGVRNLAVQSDLGPNPAIALTSRNSLSALIGTQYERDSSLGNTNRLLDPSSYVGRIWLIAASLQTSSNRYYDNKKDGFKLSNVRVETVGAVPEPASWAMMIAGFGITGFALRRRQRAMVRVSA